MANPLQPVNFFSAMDPGAAQQQFALTQQQALAQKMMEEGAQQPDPTRTAPGGWVVPYGMGEGFTHAGKQIAAALMQKNANQQQSDLQTKQMQMLATMLRNGKAPTANPMSPQAGTPSVMAGSGTEAPQITPSQAPGNDPLAAVMQIGAASQIAGPGAGTYIADMLKPTDLQKNIEASGGAVDPKSAYQHALDPVLSTRYGIYNSKGDILGGALPPNAVPIKVGPNGPQAQMYPGQADVIQQIGEAEQRGKQPFSMQTMKVPVYLPGGDQLLVEMNSKQAEQYNRTGVLPPEIAASIPGYQQPQQQGQQPQQQAMPPVDPQMPVVPGTRMSNPPMSVVPPEDRQAFNAAIPQQAFNRPALSGRPVAGRGQTQGEQVTQTRQTAGGKAVDEQFAKDYVAFTTGGASDAAKQLGQLSDVVKELENPKASLTGPTLGRVPDVIKAYTNPQSIAMRERVEEVVQRSLRAILGAQFTEKEGERLIERAYNPHLSEQENSIRVGRLFTQLQQAFDAKQSAAQYFAKNNTLEGWGGKIPNISDFDPSPRNTEGKVNRQNKSVDWNDLGR